MRKRFCRLQRRIDTPRGGHDHSDALAGLCLQAVFFDGVSELQRVFIVLDLSALGRDEGQQAVAGERVADRIGKFGREIDMAFIEVP